MTPTGSFVLVFIVIDTVTVIMLPVLYVIPDLVLRACHSILLHRLIARFRAWLESARMLGLVLAHFSKFFSQVELHHCRDLIHLH